MRRADERRSASIMINNSIRWSLAGNDVDWMTKTSAPRTFSWISTKTSISAKRLTTALVSVVLRYSAICWASAGLELPATSLIAPFFDIQNPHARVALAAWSYQGREGAAIRLGIVVPKLLLAGLIGLLVA